MAAEIGQGLLGVVSSYSKKDMGGVLKGGMGILRAATGGSQKAGGYAKQTKTSPADVVSMCLSDKRASSDWCCRSPGVVVRILKRARIQWKLARLQAP